MTIKNPTRWMATLAFATLALGATAQGKDSAVLAMVLEPTGLDPTTAPAAAIGEIVHFNVLEIGRAHV